MANQKSRRSKRVAAAPIEPATVYSILGKLSDAISVVATAANALQGAEERSGSVNAEEINDEIITLTHGVACLRAAYDEMDVALRQFADETPA
jgi:hypothetical protein